MCRRVTCNKCGKPTFAGCGAHVDQVLAGVPTAERCSCRATRPEASAKEPSPAGKRWWRS